MDPQKHRDTEKFAEQFLHAMIVLDVLTVVLFIFAYTSPVIVFFSNICAVAAMAVGGISMLIYSTVAVDKVTKYICYAVMTTMFGISILGILKIFVVLL